MGDIATDATQRRRRSRPPRGRSSPPEQVGRLAALYEVSREFASSVTDIDALLCSVARRGAELVGDMCLVTLLTADGRRLQVEAVEHPHDPEAAARTRQLFRARPYPSDRGPAGEAIRSGRPVRMVTGEDGTPGGGDADYLARFGVRSWLIVPLAVRGRPLGTLGLWRTAARPPFSADDERFVQQLADVAALALANARLLDDANRRAAQLRALYLSGAAGAAGRDPRQALAAIADQVRRQPGVDAVMVLEAESRPAPRLRVLAFDGALQPNAELPLTRPYEHVLATRRTTRVANAADLGVALADGRPPASAWIVPVPVREATAVLVVASAARLAGEPELPAFLDTVGARIASVLEVAGLEAEVRRLRAAMGTGATASPVPGLTASEQRILPLLVAGRTNEEIAAAVHLSANTVKFHVSHILRKLDAVNRVEAARAAMRLGLLHSP